MPKYVVVAPYVTLTTETPDGIRLVGFHKDAPVPPDVPADQIKYHLRDGLIEEVPAPPKPAKPVAKSDGDTKGDGSTGSSSSSVGSGSSSASSGTPGRSSAGKSGG